MWTVAKIKGKNLSIFKKDLQAKLGKDLKFYCPKVEYYKYYGNKFKKFEKFVLENYVFCYHEKFQKTHFVNEFKFLKGLEYFLDGHILNQKNITTFINYCKNYENENGYLKQSFFETIIKKKARFISGPFTNMIFEILEKQKNKLKILVGNIVTTVPNNSNCLYRPV